ncbi:helix-turn-helix transcriptional regulator [Hoeflea algicola]|nr:AlpA family phage regulatory protein [Hoeflea algicola]
MVFRHLRRRTSRERCQTKNIQDLQLPEEIQKPPRLGFYPFRLPQPSGQRKTTLVFSRRGGTMPNRNDLPSTGFVRLPAIIAPNGPIPVSKSTWWAGIKDGRFPKPVKLGPRITAWRVEDIRTLIETGGR